MKEKKTIKKEESFIVSGSGLRKLLEEEEKNIPVVEGPKNPLTLKDLEEFFEETWFSRKPDPERRITGLGYEPGRGWIPIEQTTAFQKWCQENYEKHLKEV